MKGRKLLLTLTYPQDGGASTPVYHPGAYTTAIMRALTRFPEARQAVIAELDRLEKVAA